MPHIGEKAQVVTTPPVSMAAVPVVVGASPFTYTAQRDGMLFISGGTISTVQYGRGGSLYAMTLTGGPVNVMQGDQVRIAYLTAPSLVFLPTK